MKILVMGGRRLVGASLVRNLLRKGHSVTIANHSGNKSDGGDTPVIVFDRNDRESIRNEIASNYFDVIYDMICYSPQNAIDVIDNVDCSKYIMTSSAVVYDWGRDISEDEFKAEGYKCFQGTIGELGERYGFSQGYQLGKRGAEHIISRKRIGVEESLRIRMPLVFGENDHTGRLEKIIDTVMNEQELFVDNLSSVFTVVSAENAGEYLAELIANDVSGAINIGDAVPVSIMDIFEKIRVFSGKNIRFSSNGIESGYNRYYSCVLNLEKATNEGLTLHSSSWIDELIENKIERWRSMHGKKNSW